MDGNIPVKLKDNQWYANAYEFVEDEELLSDYSERKLPISCWEAIKELRDINELIAKHKVVTIPSRNTFKNHEIFTRNNDKLFTNNWVGVISKKSNNGQNYRVEIHSRFDSGEKQYFLLYLLCTVYGFNIFDISINSENESDYIVICIVLFLHSLEEAFGDGLYKEYVRNKYNDFDFKGAFDVNRHIKQNNPFMGRTAYSVREFSYDNEILCLIRQTVDFIYDNYTELLKGYVGKSSLLYEIAEVITTATPSYRININYAESIKCGKPITHPMFEKYEVVRKLAIMILGENGQNIFDNSDEDALGLLVDISWLWEEFVSIKLLNNYNYRHLLTDGSKGALRWSAGKSWYPDFIENYDEGERRKVLDAKYKYWNDNNDDVHQLLSYLFLAGGELCGIIYPSEEERVAKSKVLLPYNAFYDEEVKLYKLPIYIPMSECDSYSDYWNIIEKSVVKWREDFEQIR